MWRRKHNRRSSVSAASPSSHHAPGASRPSSRSSLRPSARLSARPACLPHMCSLRFSSARRLIGSPFPRRLAFFSSAHRLALGSYRPGSPPHRQAGRGETKTRSTAGIGWRAAACLPRMATGCCGRSSTADGCGRGRWRGVLACLGAMDGAARSFLDRFSFPLIGSSNRLGPGSFHHPISHHLIDGEEPSFPFRPTPSRLLFSACLLWLVPPSPAGGCEGYDMGCGGWRLTGLLASRHAVPLSRCRSFARCYMICVNRAARSCLGCCGAFYGLFCPLSCRRWRF